MNSPLAISNIVVSRSVGGSDALDSSSSASPTSASKYSRGDGANAAVPSGNAIPVLLRVRRARVLAAASAGCALVSGAMFLLSHGLTVASVRVGDGGRSLEDALRTASDLNLFAGMAAALVVRPLLVLVASVAPAALLCFFTGAVMHDRDASAAAKWGRRAAAFLLYNGLLWLLSSGFHAVNTHARVSPVRSVIEGAAESAVPGDLSGADSVLRSVLDPSLAAAAARIPAVPECSRPSPQQIPAQASFAFASAPWMASVLPSGPVLTPSNSLSVPMNASGADGALPVTPEAAGTLTQLVLRAADDFLRPRTSAANASLFAVDADDVGTLAASLRSVLEAAAASQPHWSALSAADASLQLVDASLPGSVRFQAATLELPTSAAFLSRVLAVDADATTTSVAYGDANASADGRAVEFEINPKEECGRRACVVSPRGAAPSSAAADWGGQVRVLPLCVSADGGDDAAASMAADASPCGQRADSAALVVSFASRIQGDAIASTTAQDGAAALVTLTNARRVLQVTVGRLSWPADGLSVPLSAPSDSAVAVDASQLPATAELAAYVPSPLLWTPLALASAREVDAGGVLKGDLVFPRNFADASGFQELAAGDCEAERGAFLSLVERAHLFSERSLGPAALSGLFWLLQRGHATQSEASGSSPSAASTADAATVIDIQLAVPDAAAALTYAGCAALWVMALAVFLGGRQREADIESRFKPAHLARALLDNDAAHGGDGDAFGGFLGGGSGPFSRRVLHINLLHVGGRFLANSELLDEFELGGVALKHRGRASDVLVVPATQSATASYLNAVSEHHGQLDQVSGHII